MLLAAATSLALAAPALAAPADEQYLPRVPKAAGDEVAADEGEGSTILSPEARGAEGEDGEEDDSGAAAGSDDDSGSAGGSDDDSGGLGGFSSAQGTLLDPIVLLLIAGVIATAVGMTLRRRQGSDAEPQDDPPTRRGPSPRTPEGEIVGGGEPKP